MKNCSAFRLVPATFVFLPVLHGQTVTVPKLTVAVPALTVQSAAPVPGTFTLATPTLSLSSGLIFVSTPPIAGAPYCADMTTTSIQTLADGNQIQHTSKASTCRDSQGRIRSEQYLAEPAAHSVAPGEQAQMITIQDPVAGVSYVLDPVQKVAHRHATRPTTTQMADFAETRTISAGTTTMATRTFPSDNEITSAKIDLGMQIIQGVPAKGTRMTTTFAAGSIGNTQPLEVTDESWFSETLHTMVMTKNSDPRTGVNTYELTNINRAEPAAAQFQVPSDYTVKDNEGPGTVTLPTRRD
jgi:hypothetical protein